MLAADEHEEQQALIKAIGSAKVTLQQGLAAAEANGQPWHSGWDETAAPTFASAALLELLRSVGPGDILATGST